MLKLIPPDKRKSPFWTIRGVPYRGARQIERSCGTDNEEVANQIFTDLLQDISHKREAEEEKTFSFVAEAYKKWRKPKQYDVDRIDKFCGVIGDKPCSEVDQNTLVELAERFFPGCANSTLNRCVLRPVAAVIHYGADLKWYPYIRLKSWKEKKSEKEIISQTDAKRLVAESRKKPRYYKTQDVRFRPLLLLWLLKHGSRLTETLGVEGKNIDLKKKTFRLYRGKTDSYDTFDLDDEVAQELKAIFPRGLPVGRIFPWTTRWGVYGWLIPLRRRIKITFTPHLGRHTVGTTFKNMKAPLKVTMEKLGHKDVRSSMIYQADDLETVRGFSKKMKKIATSRGQTRGVND